MPDEDVRKLHQLRTEGQCCAAIMIQMGLDRRGERNDQMVSAVSVLCNGLGAGLLCGALSGAACMLALFAADPAESAEMTAELVSWFRAVYGGKYGGVDCAAITGNDQAVKLERCPALIEATYVRARDILKDYGKIVE
jgi:Putative redox-active protein (C_GCAxxG_C_C).